MIDAFRTSGSSPTLEASATTLRGRGISQVRESIRKAFDAIHSGSVEEVLELTVETSADIVIEQMPDEDSERSLSDRAMLYLKAAERRIQRFPVHAASATAHFIAVPSESAEQLFEQALKALGGCQ